LTVPVLLPRRHSCQPVVKLPLNDCDPSTDWNALARDLIELTEQTSTRAFAANAPLVRADQTALLFGPRPHGYMDMQHERINVRPELCHEALLDGEAEALTRKAMQLALAGDITALRLCLDRIRPPRKDRPLSLMRPIANAASGALLGAAKARDDRKRTDGGN
jgi:hypothetical protein